MCQCGRRQNGEVPSSGGKSSAAPRLGMEHHVLAATRTPPEHVNRTTRRGADQYVLACNARRDADEITFHTLERLEQENRRLRADVKWKLEHASTRTANWVRSRVIILGCVLAGIAALTGWMFTPNGRMGRVTFVQRFYASSEAPSYTWSRTHLITSDMTQHEIDSLLASMTTLAAKHAK